MFTKLATAQTSNQMAGTLHGRSSVHNKRHDNHIHRSRMPALWRRTLLLDNFADTTAGNGYYGERGVGNYRTSFFETPEKNR